MRNKYLIRQALVSDAEAIISVHQNAVHLTASVFYDQTILSEWSPKDPKRILKMRDKLKDNPEKTIILVIELNGQVAGFGEIAPQFEELRAVYISPDFSRQGLGRLLLYELETRARENGLTRLWLDSSLNAQEFYKASNYQVDSYGTHKLSTGRLMPCVRMSKNLT